MNNSQKKASAASKGPKPQPRIWTEEEIIEDASKAKSAFAARRLAQIKVELKDLESNKFLKCTVAAEAALKLVEDCISESFSVQYCQVELSKFLTKDTDGARAEALRYLAYPPVSTDDLETTADIPSFTKRTMDSKTAPDNAFKVLKVIKESMDSVRFPWITNPEKFVTPTDIDTIPALRDAAIRSTALLIASQQTQTARRSDEKSGLEGPIEALLTAAGYEKLKKAELPDTAALHAAVPPGSFMTECTVFTENGDFVICLWDGRFMFIECKASNSEINGRKRLNKEAVKNILVWKVAVGTIVGAAAIRGAFKPQYVQDAQNSGVYIYWEHALTALEEFLEAVNVYTGRVKPKK